jgi:hypothetical protein
MARLGILAVVLCALLAPVAHASTYIIQSTTDFANWQDTHLDLNAATTYNFTVIDPTTLWSAGSNISFPA